MGFRPMSIVGFGVVLAGLAWGQAQDPQVEASRMEVTLEVSKAEYLQGEKVLFRLRCEGTETADLRDCYYLIQYREGNSGEEFYTSRKEPIGSPSLAPGKKREWSWDQWDNERLHKAQPGPWRLAFHAPHLRTEPFRVYFKIEQRQP